MSNDDEFGAMIRPITIQPRKRGYIHRPIVVWHDKVLVTEDGTVIDDVPKWILNAGPHLVVTQQVPWLVDVLLTMDNVQVRLSDSRPDVDGPSFSKPKIISFGKPHVEGRRRQGQHIVLDVQKLFNETMKSSPNRSALDLLTLGNDVRSFCCEQNIPIKVTPAGIAGSLSTDVRFAPDGQYQVPKKTNERVREFLPGVRHTSHAIVGKFFKRASTLDQRRAYHRAAQSVDLPSAKTLYARGHYGSFRDRPDKVWLKSDDKNFSTTLNQHGLFIVRATQTVKPSEFAPRVCHLAYKDKTGWGGQVPIWSNEIQYARECGLKITGIYASWTSPDADTVLPAYATFAESTIDSASPQRAKWLKPTLHARYGLLGARPRKLFMAGTFGKGTPALWNIGQRSIAVQETELPAFSPRTANVPALGMLQIEIETRTLSTAIMLTRMGYTVLHTHADGLHVQDAQLPNLGPDWTMEPMTDLVYEDEVSWTSKERDVLPGRDTGARKDALRRAASRRHAWTPDKAPEPRGMFRD